MTSDIFDDVLNLEEQYHQEGYEAGYRDGAEAGRVEGRSVGMKQGYEKFVEAGRLQGRALVWANRIPRFRSPLPPAAQEQAARSQTQTQTQTLSSPSPITKPSATTHTQRPPSSSPAEESVRTAAAAAAAAATAGDNTQQQGETRSHSHSNSNSTRLPDLSPSNNARLEKNVATLYGMVEPGTLSTRNDDEDVNDVDSRVKGAQGKLKVIERVVGEQIPTTAADDLEKPGSGATAGGSKNSNIEDIGRIPKPPPKQPPPPQQDGPE